MAQTDLNLVLGVSFNRSVAQDTARYWEKDEGNLSHLIDQVDDVLDYSELGKLAKENMKQNFTWKKIVGEYEELFYHEVNILLSTYNGEQYLAEQVKSIQEQTYQEWKLLIRDDGSSDGTVEIIKQLAARDSRIHFINENHVENVGVIKSSMPYLSMGRQTILFQ